MSDETNDMEARAAAILASWNVALDRLWIIVQHPPNSGGKFTVHGPVEADTGSEAIVRLCTGQSKYVATKKGRYHAIPLAIWQGGCRDWTQTRGLEEVSFPSITPLTE